MRVLIVSMRYLGDCVVSAALAGAVKEKMPDAEVWMLTFKRNLPILEGIDILDGVIGVEAKPSYLKQLKEMASVWKKFDWSIITHQSTRTFLYGAAAGRRQSMFDVSAKSQNGWQRLFISDFVPKLGGIHKLDAISVVLKPLLNEVPHPDPVAPNAPRRFSRISGTVPLSYFTFVLSIPTKMRPIPGGGRWAKKPLRRASASYLRAVVRTTRPSRLRRSPMGGPRSTSVTIPVASRSGRRGL